MWLICLIGVWPAGAWLIVSVVCCAFLAGWSHRAVLQSNPNGPPVLMALQMCRFISPERVRILTSNMDHFLATKNCLNLRYYDFLVIRLETLENRIWILAPFFQATILVSCFKPLHCTAAILDGELGEADIRVPWNLINSGKTAYCNEEVTGLLMTGDRLLSSN